MFRHFMLLPSVNVTTNKLNTPFSSSSSIRVVTTFIAVDDATANNPSGTTSFSCICPCHRYRHLCWFCCIYCRWFFFFFFFLYSSCFCWYSSCSCVVAMLLLLLLTMMLLIIILCCLLYCIYYRRWIRCVNFFLHHVFLCCWFYHSCDLFCC